MIAAIPAVFWSTVMLLLLANEEGKIMNLSRLVDVFLFEMRLKIYPVIIMNADSVAANLQYHLVRSRSL